MTHVFAELESLELAKRLLAGDKRALARGISLVENDDPAGWQLVRDVYPRTGNARIIGFTGPPGVGKSTLIGALVKHSRERKREVGVLSGSGIESLRPQPQALGYADRLTAGHSNPEKGKRSNVQATPTT